MHLLLKNSQHYLTTKSYVNKTSKPLTTIPIIFSPHQNIQQHYPKNICLRLNQYLQRRIDSSWEISGNMCEIKVIKQKLSVQVEMAA